MYWVSEATNIQSRHRLKVFQESTMSNRFIMIQRTSITCGNLVRFDKEEITKLKDTQLHLFMIKKCHFLMLETVFGTIHTQSNNEIDIRCTYKACTLNFSSYEKLKKNLNSGHHKFEVGTRTQSSKVTHKWMKRFHQSTPHSVEKQMPWLSSNMTCSTSGSKHSLKKGWGIPGSIETDTKYSKEASQKNIRSWQSQERNRLVHRLKSNWGRPKHRTNTSQWRPSSHNSQGEHSW